MSTAAKLRASLPHPVIDADGHWLEFGPVISNEMEKIGGKVATRAMQMNGSRVRDSLNMSPAQRRHANIAQEAFWGSPTKNTIDRATAMMPRLLYERLDAMGIDFSILFPTMGLGLPRVNDTEARLAACRAFNIYTADLFAQFKDRMTPAAVIPMHTPDEAIEELEYAVNELEYKVVMLNSLIDRPITKVVEEHPNAQNLVSWIDTFGIDSAYDYDSVWDKCRELGVSPTFHRGSRGKFLRISVSNFCYNHIGHFAAASEAVCKALFLGGITRRYPDLNFGFLEGGVGFAVLLFADLINHWEIRNAEALSFTDPASLDVKYFEELAEQYGGSEMFSALKSGRGLSTKNGSTTTGGLNELDDYAACEIDSEADFKELFVDRFYFGCEADDANNALAFNTKTNPLNAEIKTLFGSDIGHFDVQDMLGVLPEAYELVEDEKISVDDFRHFVCDNPIRFWGETNPSFFEGTSVAKTAQDTLAR